MKASGTTTLTDFWLSHKGERYRVFWQQMFFMERLAYCIFMQSQCLLLDSVAWHEWKVFVTSLATRWPSVVNWPQSQVKYLQRFGCYITILPTGLENLISLSFLLLSNTCCIGELLPLPGSFLFATLHVIYNHKCAQWIGTVNGEHVSALQNMFTVPDSLPSAIQTDLNIHAVCRLAVISFVFKKVLVEDREWYCRA